jgi:hypothetical protein
MFLKAKLVAHLFCILLICAYPLGLWETTLLLLCILISRSVPQPDVFLQPVQSVGALISLVKILFCFLILVSFFNKNNFSLFFFSVLLSIVFYCVFYCVPVIWFWAVVNHINTLKPKLVYIPFKNSVRTAKKIPHFTITKIKWLMLWKKIISFYTENHTKPINTKCSVTDF